MTTYTEAKKIRIMFPNWAGDQLPGKFGTASRSIFKMLRNVMPSSKPILKPVRCHFLIYLGFQLALESFSRVVWHCTAQHFQNAAHHSAKLPRTPILKPVRCHFMIYLRPGVYGH
jgi:hypothetical protein